MSAESPSSNVPNLITRFEQLGLVSPQQSRMPLPASVKIRLPEPFDRTFDLYVLEFFFFTIERYFELIGLDDENQRRMLLAILVIGHASVLLRVQWYDYNDVGNSDIKVDMLQRFTPANNERRARDALAWCTQHHNTQVTGYIAAFICAALKVHRMIVDEKLDRFLQGLRAPILGKVLMVDVDSLQMPAKLWKELPLSLATFKIDRLAQIKDNHEQTLLIQDFEARGQWYQGQQLGRMSGSQAGIRMMMVGIKVDSLKDSKGVSFRDSAITIESIGTYQGTVGTTIGMIGYGSKVDNSRVTINLWDVFRTATVR